MDKQMDRKAGVRWRSGEQKTLESFAGKGKEALGGVPELWVPDQT